MKISIPFIFAGCVTLPYFIGYTHINSLLIGASLMAIIFGIRMMNDGR